ncbi:glycosyltransferase, partial [Escherichia coli]|nr:glycosyltransferase [Escherichia coli]
MDKVNRKTVAVIMPMFNAEKTIIRAIESVCSQTYADWHLYI